MRRGVAGPFTIPTPVLGSDTYASSEPKELHRWAQSAEISARHNDQLGSETSTFDPGAAA
jgi:hypothetical protein